MSRADRTTKWRIGRTRTAERGLWATAVHFRRCLVAVPFMLTTHAPALYAQVPDHEPMGAATEGDLGAGWMAMPWANVCSTVDCVRGDGSFTFHLLGLFHFHRHWALGLGGHFALWPTAQPTLSDQARAADRELSRDYYAITLELRYFPWRQTVGAPAPKTLHPYVGADLGFALLSDRYHSPPLDQSGAVRIGEPGFLLRNQGALARVVVGTDLGLSQHWALGLTLRSGAIWFAGPKSTTFGDQSTLSGWNFSLAATLSIKAYLNL